MAKIKVSHVVGYRELKGMDRSEETVNTHAHTHTRTHTHTHTHTQTMQIELLISKL